MTEHYNSTLTVEKSRDLDHGCFVFDAMAHLNDARISETEAQAMLKRASKAGISWVVNAGFDPVTDRAVPIHPGVKVLKAYGLHPLAIDTQWVSNQLDDLASRIQEEDVVAIGEIGLDARATASSLGTQELAFTTQLHLAYEMNRPAIVHCVGRIGRLYEILKEHFKQKRLPRILLHGFGESEEMVRKFQKLGCYFSVGGTVCLKSFKRMRRFVQICDARRLMVESDCPDHSVEPERYSEPSDIVRTLQEVADLRNEAFDLVAQRTARCARDFYRVAQP